jgi:hypothetical protein
VAQALTEGALLAAYSFKDHSAPPANFDVVPVGVPLPTVRFTTR